MVAETDTRPVVVLTWTVGIVGVTCGLWVGLTGRARFFRHDRVHQGPFVHLLGLVCAALAAALGWYTLAHPALQ